MANNNSMMAPINVFSGHEVCPILNQYVKTLPIEINRNFCEFGDKLADDFAPDDNIFIRGTRRSSTRGERRKATEKAKRRAEETRKLRKLHEEKEHRDCEVWYGCATIPGTHTTFDYEIRDKDLWSNDRRATRREGRKLCREVNPADFRNRWEITDDGYDENYEEWYTIWTLFDCYGRFIRECVDWY